MKTASVIHTLLGALSFTLLLASAAMAQGPVWKPLGPAPIRESAAADDVKNEESGKVLAILVHPTNPKIVYVGTGNGGLYRSLDGGNEWTLIDLPAPAGPNGQIMSIGALAVSPSNHSTLFVGTGDARGGVDNFFGVGVYVVRNADSATPMASGPFGKGADRPDLFTGTSITQIIVDPADEQTIFVSTIPARGGIGLIGNNENNDLGPDNRGLGGLYRTTNALAAEPNFTRLTEAKDVSIRDMVIEPGNAKVLLYATNEEGGGVWRTDDALGPQPKFEMTRSLSNFDPRLAINKVGEVVTVLLATSEAPLPAPEDKVLGKVMRSTDGGKTWPDHITAADGFAGEQANINVAIDPTNAKIFYVGGADAPGKKVMIGTVDGGDTFNKPSPTATYGLHPDTQVIRIAPSDPSTIYLGCDGGIWKTTRGAQDWKTVDAKWENLNNATFSATQFTGLAQHPKVRDYLVGGTQDNGTNFLRSNGTWFEMAAGDGGVALIDQNATDASVVTIYHTYSNTVGAIKFDRVTMNGDVVGATKSIGAAQGINQKDSTVLFYNPMAVGPGNPNSVYFGTDRLYRSADRGDTMTVVAGPFEDKIAVSAIGVSVQDDNVRIVGLENGKVFATNTGSAMTEVTPQSGGNPVSNYVSRAFIDPNVKTTAYVTYAGYKLAAGATIWKTTNFDAAAPTWTAIGNGVLGPVNAFAVDPRASTHLYAGTDLGVFASTDGGTTWAPYGTGLPRITVWDMSVNKDFGVLRIATHGRGMWEIAAAAPANEPSIVPTPAVAAEGAAPAAFARQAAQAANALANFVINLSGPSTHLVSFHYSTVDGTAKAGTDYVAQSGTITFQPGQTQQTISVEILDDSHPEPTESFSIQLSDPVGGSLADDDVSGTIMSEEAAAVLSIAPATVIEGAPATTTDATFQVTLSPASNQTVTVDFTTVDVSASAGNDYQPVSGTVTFAAGETMQPIAVPVRGDALAEENENFRVVLSNPTGEANLGTSSALGTISNDDGAAPATSMANTTANAVNSGGASAIYPSTINVSGLAGTVSKVTVRLVGLSHSYPSDLDVLLVGPQGQKVMLMSDAGGFEAVTDLNLGFDDSAVLGLDADDSAVAGTFKPTDFEAGDVLPAPAPAGPFGALLAAFNGTDPNGAWRLFVFDDSTGDGGAIGEWSLSISTQTAPAVPFITIADVNVVEGNGGTAGAVFAARLSAASATPVTVNFATADGTASEGQDYTGATGTVTFAPGQTTQAITVSVLGSLDVEGDQTFFVDLSNAAGATLADNQAMATIVNDDVIPRISINNLGEEKSVKDGAGQNPKAVFTVSLAEKSSQEVRVDFATEDREATAGQDYEATAGTLIFAPGETAKPVPVRIILDDTNEGDETFVVKLANPVNGVLFKDEGVALVTGGSHVSIRTRGQPKDMRVLEGLSAFFIVSSRGSGLTYQWKFNGVPIPGATNRVLEIPKAKLADEGLYNVVVSNGIETDESEGAELAVDALIGMNALTGHYQGLVGGDAFTHGSSGYIRLKVLRGAGVTGQLSYGGRKYYFTGRFKTDGTVILVLGSGSSRVTLSLQLDQSGAGGVSGTVSGGGGGTSDFFADAGAPGGAATGRYTVILPRNPLHPEATFPQGHGHGVVTVDRLGNLRFAGKLGDGAGVAQGSRLSAEGWWPFYVAPYGGSGSASGWVQFRDLPGKSDLDGTLDWFRPDHFEKSYRAGFTTEIELEGSLYVKTAGQSVLNLAPSGFGNVKLENGNLAAALAEVIKLDTNSRVTVTQNNDRFTMSITPATGAFLGSFVTPTGEKRKFTGAIFQKLNIARGVFLGLDQAGLIEIAPQ